MERKDIRRVMKECRILKGWTVIDGGAHNGKALTHLEHDKKVYGREGGGREIDLTPLADLNLAKQTKEAAFLVRVLENRLAELETEMTDMFGRASVAGPEGAMKVVQEALI